MPRLTPGNARRPPRARVARRRRDHLSHPKRSSWIGGSPSSAGHAASCRTKPSDSRPSEPARGGRAFRGLRAGPQHHRQCSRRPPQRRARSPPRRLTAELDAARRAARSCSTAGCAKPFSARLARGDLTMSEIAIRCGRCKRDRRGNVSGETSWLARRIGLAPEAGRDRADAMGSQRRPGADRARRARSQPTRGRTVSDRRLVAARPDPIPMVARLRRAREMGIGPAPGGASERRDGG